MAGQSVADNDAALASRQQALQHARGEVLAAPERAEVFGDLTPALLAPLRVGAHELARLDLGPSVPTSIPATCFSCSVESSSFPESPGSAIRTSAATGAPRARRTTSAITFRSPPPRSPQCGGSTCRCGCAMTTHRRLRDTISPEQRLRCYGPRTSGVGCRTIRPSSAGLHIYTAVLDDGVRKRTSSPLVSSSISCPATTRRANEPSPAPHRQ